MPPDCTNCNKEMTETCNICGKKSCSLCGCPQCEGNIEATEKEDDDDL